MVCDDVQMLGEVIYSFIYCTNTTSFNGFVINNLVRPLTILKNLLFYT
jgi:hypothetical protein